ncbi:hypothetical protein ON010_g6598 [Phytophthora cinnamomi]|nr:hypothetical protein ON010_g6598 [Phytophthora cinnamomi]
MCRHAPSLSCWCRTASTSSSRAHPAAKLPPVWLLAARDDADVVVARDAVTTDGGGGAAALHEARAIPVRWHDQQEDHIITSPTVNATPTRIRPYHRTLYRTNLGRFS